jgi:hypothetical protein
MSRKEKNNHGNNDHENTGRRRILDDNEKENDYADENYNVTDSDAAEIDPRIRQASQSSDNTIEEGDEDYDDEEKEKID